MGRRVGICQHGLSVLVVNDNAGATVLGLNGEATVVVALVLLHNVVVLRWAVLPHSLLANTSQDQQNSEEAKAESNDDGQDNNQQVDDVRVASVVVVVVAGDHGVTGHQASKGRHDGDGVVVRLYIVAVKECGGYCYNRVWCSVLGQGLMATG